MPVKTQRGDGECEMTKAKRALLIFAAMAALFGCEDGKTVMTTPDGMVVKEIPNERPEFERVYEIQLDTRAHLKVTMRTRFDGERDSDGELTQPNGNWISFDPKNIAEKIIDPVLVPKVQERVDQIFALDEHFMASGPNQFTDSGGRTWQRIK